MAYIEVNGRVLDSNSLVDLLYVAYNRDNAEIYGVDKAIRAGYDELYSTAPDVLDKKMVAIDHQIEKEAFEKANQKVIEAKSDKQKALEKRQAQKEDLIDILAKSILEQNKNIVGKEIAQRAIDKVNQDTAKRRGRPRKQKEENTQSSKENINQKDINQERMEQENINQANMEQEDMNNEQRTNNSWAQNEAIAQGNRVTITD